MKEDRRIRKHVRVVEERDEQGKIMPLCIYYNDREYIVEKVLDVQNHAATKAGGLGVRYRVRLSNEEDGIHGKTTFLYLERYAEPARWFVEEKVRHACSDIVLT